MNLEISNNVICHNVICLGKWLITCTATKNPITSCPVSVLFLPQLGEKMPWFLPFTIFLLTEQMWQPSKDVSLIIKGKMVSGKCQCFFEETFPMVITIFQTVQKYALSFVRCQACQVWIMVVLQALWCQCLVNSEPVPTIFMWAQIYYNREEQFWHCWPQFSFLYIF